MKKLIQIGAVFCARFSVTLSIACAQRGPIFDTISGLQKWARFRNAWVQKRWPRFISAPTTDAGLAGGGRLQTLPGKCQAWADFEAIALQVNLCRHRRILRPTCWDVFKVPGAEGVAKPSGAEGVTNSCATTAGV